MAEQILPPLSEDQKQTVINLFDKEFKLPTSLILKASEFRGSTLTEKDIIERYIFGLMSGVAYTRLSDRIRFADVTHPTYIKKFIIDYHSLIVMYDFYSSQPLQKTITTEKELSDFVYALSDITKAEFKYITYIPK